MKIMGIDPGLDGALALIEDGKPSAWTVMPTVTVKGGKRRAYDIPALKRWFAAIQPDYIVLELQQAMPASFRGRMQGTVSSFSIGYGYGVLCGMLGALEISHSIVHPKTWGARLLKDASGTTKERANIVAARLFPKIDFRASERCKNNHDGKVDAMLIAWYGHLTYGGHS